MKVNSNIPVSFKPTAYFKTIKQASAFDDSTKIGYYTLLFGDYKLVEASLSDFKNNFQYETNFFLRKIMAIPKSLYCGVILSVCHIARAILTSTSTAPLKRAAWKQVVEDFNESYSWFLTLLDDSYVRQFRIQRAQFNKQCYTHILNNPKAQNTDGYNEIREELKEVLKTSKINAETLYAEYEPLRSIYTLSERKDFYRLFLVLGDEEKINKVGDDLCQFHKGYPHLREKTKLFIQALKFHHKLDDPEKVLQIKKQIYVLYAREFFKNNNPGYLFLFEAALKNGSHRVHTTIAQDATDNILIPELDDFLKNDTSIELISIPFLFINISTQAKNSFQRLIEDINCPDESSYETPYQAQMTREEAFEMLGLRNRANEIEIKKAFKKLVLKYHPDKTARKPNESEERYHARKAGNESKFVNVKKAYELLTAK